MIRFASALREIFDLIIFYENFGTQKIALVPKRLVLAFECFAQLYTRVIVRVRSRLFGAVRGLLFELVVLHFYAANVRVRSLLFVAVRCMRCSLFMLVLHSTNGRVRSRPFATSRVRSHLTDVGDVSLDRVGSYEILLTSLGLDFVTVEFVDRTVFLNCADCAWVAGRGI